MATATKKKENPAVATMDIADMIGSVEQPVSQPFSSDHILSPEISAAVQEKITKAREESTQLFVDQLVGILRGSDSSLFSPSFALQQRKEELAAAKAKHKRAVEFVKAFDAALLAAGAGNPFPFFGILCVYHENDSAIVVRIKDKAVSLAQILDPKIKDWSEINPEWFAVQVSKESPDSEGSEG